MSFSSIPSDFTICPRLPLLMHNIHPSLSVCPLYPHKNGFKSGGKFIRSKNKNVSASVLLPCRVPQGCTVLWMSPVFSPCLWRELIYFPKDTQKQLSLLFCSFVIVVIPFQANLALVLSCGCAAVRMRPRTQQQ